MSAYEQAHRGPCDESEREGLTRRDWGAKQSHPPNRDLLSKNLLLPGVFRNGYKLFYNSISLYSLFLYPSQVVLPILHALQQPQRRDLLLDRPRANHAIERGGNSRTNTMMKLGDGERKSKLQAVSTVPHNSYDRNHNSATHAAAPPLAKVLTCAPDFSALFVGGGEAGTAVVPV